MSERFGFAIFSIFLSEFDDYYMSLRPPMNNEECNDSSEANIPHANDSGLMVNCRNVWFREFWSQHHKCEFGGSENACTGNEVISDYEQEGLVPFVGKFLFYNPYLGAYLICCDRTTV